MKAVCIAGTASGVGKTTLAAGIMGLLKKNGYSVAPFKVGPDYIDPQFHTFITGNSCSNLDSFFCDDPALEFLFQRNGQDKDICVVEGVMGLYDGLGTTDTGSTASVVKKLGIPVILVVDGKASSRSTAAVIKGFCSFDREVNIAGVIFNRISGDRHYKLLKEIVEKYTSLKCLGYLANNKDLLLQSRHLGLIPAGEVKDLTNQLELLIDTLEVTLDLPGLIEISRQYSWREHQNRIPAIPRVKKKFKLAYAFDEAFNFYYHDNLLLLKDAGISLIPFSPLRDKKLPSFCDALYIGGGFPEEFAQTLSSNQDMLDSIRNQLEDGLPAFGECGGLMYLTEGIICKDDSYYPMAGFFNTRCRMTKGLKRFGYARLEYDQEEIRVHEFHHSCLIEKEGADYSKTYRVTRASTGESWECGLYKKNCLAGYAHLHFYANLDFFKKILKLFTRNHR